MMYGIVLEGGGARGAYHVGVWKALNELGIDFKGVAGTSVGALNGAMMVQKDLEQALEVWSEITPSKIINIDDKFFEKLKNRKISAEDTTTLIQYIKAFLQNRGLDTTPLHSLLYRYIDEKRIRNAGIEFGFVTISLTELAPLKLFLNDIPEGKLIDYLLASASLPFFQMQRIDNNTFLDGGVFDNLPISLLAEKGFKNIIAVRLVRKGLKKWENRSDLNITLIKPNESLGNMLDFTKERAINNINLGYYDTLRVYKGYQGSRYYLNGCPDDDYFLHILLQMDKTGLNRLRKQLGIRNMPEKRFILEKLVPLLVDMLSLGHTASYRDILISILERAAAKTAVNRFEVYEYKKLEQMVIESYRLNHQAPLPGLLKGNELLLRAKKEQFLDEITEILFNGIKQN
ncbi:MAG: patatin-like phospholipase family protein [Thermacetogeniaceae bacterium]|jgi:NTE family protein|nr:patatin-like phospholipase family protein [Syntrophomonadaceae bacterium]